MFSLKNLACKGLSPACSQRVWHEHNTPEFIMTAVLLFFSERQICREKVGELMSEKILAITENMNRHEYVPKMPNQSDLELIFETNFADVQPYCFKVRVTH